MYIDAMHDRKNDLIKVVERQDGKRVYKDYPVDHHFYITDKDGRYKSIFDDRLRKISPKNKDEKQKLINAYPSSKLWESDVNPVLRCLENNYLHKPEPSPNVAFFDIETDFNYEFGYSSPEDALNKITSIAVYLQWLDRMVCVALPPPTLTFEEADKIAGEVGDCIIVDSESEMLSMFMSLIEDADIISGWNSDQFDILYVINRIIKVMGENETRRLCLWNQVPIKKEVMSKEDDEADEEVLYYTYVLSGRVHLDYMQLYKKYTYEQRQSYSLDNISFLELDERKVQYDGTLDQLYKQDFKKFLEYNIQDTYLLHKLDQKLKYISLANGIAHNNVVLFSHTMGTVSTTEQAILVEAHSNGLVIPNRKPPTGDTKAAGGWTPHPKPGLHYWIANTDMNSLYPSVIRALNMSPETLIGQIRLDRTNSALAAYLAQGKKYKFTGFWNGKFNVYEMDYVFNKDISEKLILDMVDGKSYEVTGAEIYQLVFESGKPWAISANGTIFTYEKVGIIPSLLGRWYSERKQMQAKEKQYASLKDGRVKLDESIYHKIDVQRMNDFDLAECYDESTLLKLIEDGDATAINVYLNQHGLIVKNGLVVCEDTVHNADVVSFWDKRQLVRKINLNSVYGGLLNAHHRFFDQRIGQSTTLTGRSICKHMAAKTNEVITGEYDHDGMAIIYGDTDSENFDTIHETNFGTKTVEDLFNMCDVKWSVDDKEYAFNNELQVLYYDKSEDIAKLGNINYIYRHKVSKSKWEIEDEFGNKVVVTEDHSVMVERNGILMQVKPSEIDYETDFLITYEKN